MSFLTVLFLAATFFLTLTNTSLRRLSKTDAQKEINSLGNLFFYRKFHQYFFKSRQYDGLFFATLCAQNFCRFCYVASFISLLAYLPLFHAAASDIDHHTFNDLAWVWAIVILLFIILVTFFIVDFIPRILGTYYPQFCLRFSAPFSSPFMLLVFPITYIYLKILHVYLRSAALDLSVTPTDEQDIIDMLQDEDLNSSFELHERKLIESVVKFKERIAREVMVPRVDLFSLPDTTSIKDAATQLENEGYSRTPIYHNTIDNIVGVLMYKDILKKYMEYEQKGNDASILAAPISSIQKSVLHTPETKKISSLLQEFRKKQLHLAIVVDEYGGTEGIVTIEDILEEIVGDIADEYDQEEALFRPQHDGSWIVDARMSVVDIEDELGISIPEDGEYDTIGGFIYHTTGIIPPKGYVIHHDEFDIEILESNERSVESVKLRKRIQEQEKNNDN
jgi:putative hemolysin